MEFKAPVVKIRDGFEVRVPREDDALQLARVVDENRDYLRQWLPWLDVSLTMQDSLGFIQRSQSDWSLRRIYTGLIFKKDEIVGAIGFHSKVHRYMDVGYWVSKKYAGKGLCSDAASALIKWAFKFYEGDVQMIELKAATDNLASRKVAEKLKFHYEGVLRKREWLYDHFVDHAIYSITQEEWRKHNKT